MSDAAKLSTPSIAVEACSESGSALRLEKGTEHKKSAAKIGLNA